MGRRIAYLGMAAAVCVALFAGISLTPGCYDVPQPACGFFCGAQGACPEDYTCNNGDNRCHLNGSPPQQCLPLIDAGPLDVPDSIGVDVPTDIAVDGNTPPTVTAMFPTSGSTAVAITTTVTATFSENVTGVSSSTFTLTTGGNAVPAAVTYTPFGFVATLTPSSPLAANATYTAMVTSGISDQDGAPLTTTSWTFTTGADTIAPMVTARTPAPNATGVPTSSTVTATFDEPVTGISNSTFTLMDGATAIPGTVTYASGTRTATFTPTGMLPPGTLLTATLTSGIADAASNALSGAPVTWTFTTMTDTVAPTVTMRSPAANATMVATSTTIVATFSEPVMNVTATTFTVNAGSAVAGSLASSNGGQVWTFTPTAALAPNATVSVTLTTGITDLNGNALAAADTWMFTTAPDTTAPTVMSTTPAANATMVPTASTIAVTFSEPVTGVTSASFTVNAAGAVAGTLAASNGGRTWTFTPTSSLPMGTTATVTLGTAIQDLAGNALAAPFMFTFMTLSDTTAPTVTSTTPVANNPNTPLTSSVVITFSEPVTNVTTSTFIVDDGSPVSGTLSSSSMGRTWTFTPTNQLAGMAMVTVTLSTGIRDLASNALAAPFAYMFMTVADTFPPTLQSSVPASGATGVSTTATVSVTFNEPATNVNGSTFVVSTGGGVFVIPGTYVSSNGGRTWTYTPNFPYSAAAAVGVSLKAGIQDLLGNATTADMNFSFMTQ